MDPFNVLQSVPSFLRGYWALSVFSTMEGCCRLGGSTSWVGGFENSFGKGSTGWKSEGARHHAFLNQGSLLDLRNKMLVKGFGSLGAVLQSRKVTLNRPST